MGADPQRESSVCGHPGINMVDGTQKATATDEYATRHNPFVYFHSIIDDTTLCDTHVVGLDMLTKDLASAADTPNYVFITPDLCNDGHDAPCANGQPGGLAQADGFLRKWVPLITNSPAFKQQNGLLIITFDESETSDASSCCGEIPGPGSPLPGIFGMGGGDVGAVLLSPCIAPGTVSQTPYNHYTMLRSVEDLFGLSHLGYAGLSGEQSFGSDVFTRSCPLAAANAPPSVRIKAPSIASNSVDQAADPALLELGRIAGDQLHGPGAAGRGRLADAACRLNPPVADVRGTVRAHVSLPRARDRRVGPGRRVCHRDHRDPVGRSPQRQPLHGLLARHTRQRRLAGTHDQELQTRLQAHAALRRWGARDHR